MLKKFTQSFRILLCEEGHPKETLLEGLEASGLVFEVSKSSDIDRCLDELSAKEYHLVLLHTGQPESELVTSVRSLAPLLKNTVLMVVVSKADSVASKLLKAGADEVFGEEEWQPSLIKRVLPIYLERKGLQSKVEDLKKDHKEPTNENHLVEIFDSVSDAILILDEEYTIGFLNDAAASLLDSERDSLIGEVFPFSLDSKGTDKLEITGRDGTNRVYEVGVNELDWQSQRSRFILLKDVTLTDRSESALVRSSALLDSLVESILSGVIVVDAQGKVSRMNAESERLTGVTENQALGVNLENILWVQHPRTGRRVNHFAEVFLGPDYLLNQPTGGVELTNRQGETLYVRLKMKQIEVSGENSSAIVVLRDINLRADTPLERHESEKLNAVGLLASGIGHDFNNILSAVLGNISVARMGLEKAHPISRQLVLAEKAALQAKGLTKQLISFVKGGIPNLEATTLNVLVEDCSQFILRGSNVKCVTDISEGLWPVEVDIAQMSQVITNLIINADQSMPNGGMIELRLYNETVSSNNRIEHVPAGEYVVFSVQDHGVGISEENVKHIFDPYFSTKKNGNGLGLASCQSIIKSHRGLISVDSSLGVGTTFKVFLPRSKVPADSAAEYKSEAEELPRPEKMGGRILVMDDMEGMMLVAGEILKTLGFEVGLSTNGQEAINAYKAAKEAGNPFDAVVFDLTVPGGMGGEEACQILREYDPDLIAIASSGYTNSNVMSDFESAGFKAVVPKPYRIKEMSDALNRILKTKKLN